MSKRSSLFVNKWYQIKISCLPEYHVKDATKVFEYNAISLILSEINWQACQRNPSDFILHFMEFTVEIM